MATTADFVGKNCPHCGAIDSLQADDALGEVACTECALVVAMGLEENALTRFDKDATYDDVDRHREREDTTAPALHGVSSPSGGGGGALSKVTLHPAMLNCIRSLQKKSAAPEEAIGRAVNLAKTFVGGRRARGQRVEKQQDVAAACFMIAAEQMNHPVPLAELRYLDATLGDVEFRRAEIVKETRMEEEERRLKLMYVDNLLTTYLRRLGLQLSLYMPRCMQLMEAFQRVESVSTVGVVDKIIMALLLSLTSRSFQWEGAPSAMNAPNNIGITSGSGSSTVSTETVYANFAAKAHLDVNKVKKLMQTTTNNMQAIVMAFESVKRSSNGAQKSVKENGNGSGDDNNQNASSDDTARVAKRVKMESP